MFFFLWGLVVVSLFCWMLFVFSFFCFTDLSYYLLIFLWLASICYRSVFPFFSRLSLKRISRFTIPQSRAVSHRLPMPQTSIGSTSKVEEVRCRAFVLFGVQWKHPKMDGFIWFPSSEAPGIQGSFFRYVGFRECKTIRTSGDKMIWKEMFSLYNAVLYCGSQDFITGFSFKTELF